MKNMREFKGRGKVPLKYRLGGIGGNGCSSERERDADGGRDGSLRKRRGLDNSLQDMSDGGATCDYSSASKFEWESLMGRRRNGDDLRNAERNLMEDREGCDDVFRDTTSLETDRERELLHYCPDVGQIVNPRVVDRKLYLAAKNGNSGKVDVEGRQEEEILRRRKYLHEEGKHSFYTETGPFHMVPSPPPRYSSLQPQSSGNLSKAGAKPQAGIAELGSLSKDNIGPGVVSDYAPLPKTSKYQPQSRTPSPLCSSKPSDYREHSLINEKYVEGNSEGRRCYAGDDSVRISSGNSFRCVTSSPYLSSLNATVPLSVGCGSKEEYVSLREGLATENIVNKKHFHREDGTSTYSDYVPRCMMPSPQSESRVLTPPIVCGSPDIEHAFVPKQAVAKMVGRENYFKEENGPRYHTGGLRHVMPSPSKLEPETRRSLSVSHASDPVTKSSSRLLPKPEQCPVSMPQMVPSYYLLSDTELSRESSMRVKELPSNELDPDVCAFHRRNPEYCTRDENCAFYEDDIKRRYYLRSNENELHGKFPRTLEEHGPRDRLWVHDKNGVDAYGRFHGFKPKGGMLLQNHPRSQEQDYIIHPHHSVEPCHSNQDFEMFHHNIFPCDVRIKDNDHEDQKSAAYEDQQDKFNLLDNDPDADGGFYIDKQQSNILEPGYFHSSTCCDSGLPRNSRALLKGGYVQDNRFAFYKPYIKHQEHLMKHIADKDADELEHLSLQDLQCQMLMRRSAHIQNKDFTEVADEALDNRNDFDGRLPFKKLPIWMRLGEPNNSNVSDIKKRLRPAPQISDFLLSKKHKSFNTSVRKNDLEEPGADYSSPPDASKLTSEIAELDECSEKFEELVNRAFLEFLKHLFDSSTQQRKYKGLDNYESLRCDVCGSLKEYKDTHSLAKHALNYVKMDLRAQHLGLHKALCVLMGWKGTVSLNNPMNLLQLSESEHFALMGDLIIWPPVVIVHNSSVGNKDLRKQQIITVRKLDTILEGKGFGGNNHKVHIGNDQGVMVVKFNATLSGLHAAQELHKFYADNKHGRVELLHLTPNNGCSNHEDSQKATPNVEDILYGYLGTVEDLPKLDSHTKRWSLIKSKKELLATAL